MDLRDTEHLRGVFSYVGSGSESKPCSRSAHRENADSIGRRGVEISCPCPRKKRRRANAQYHADPLFSSIIIKLLICFYSLSFHLLCTPFLSFLSGVCTSFQVFIQEFYTFFVRITSVTASTWLSICLHIIFVASCFSWCVIFVISSSCSAISCGYTSGFFKYSTR